MTCKHFGACGSCSLYTMPYEDQLKKKKEELAKLLEPFYRGETTPFASEDAHYRARAEYKIYHDEEGCHYAMRHLDKKSFVTLGECPMVAKPIEKRMWRLLDLVNGDETLENRLFGVEFLSTTTDEVLVTMLYHRKLDEAWIEKARYLEEELSAKIIGRSRKQKIVLSEEFVTETLCIEGKTYRYRHYEQSFTQPNPKVNEKMIGWAMAQARRYGRGDFCELYAGAGNFTIPLSTLFAHVIATEISKRSIHAALENCRLNGVENITFVRMSSEEFTEALEGKRTFTRLKEVDLDAFDIGTMLVDPPRAGLDEGTRKLIAKFDTIVYISCNPQTLARDLEELCRTHRVEDAALFDQFPYTSHMEAGVVLTKM
ncbi:tRNA (uridine(54)-C5)-methyltransferase TrmA [Hydrogenimonas cancrithermarum]|uniref:tRNA/tmRNA (Uracil-C(5))-methyltransferase n=1 Tax=Hydrogenimonas cancrithermarum TaxID=2993563 RepID=A0ABN6WTC5_9BACT|nr:tRNA (uridine(54)-C5)-methyltransferase TrmA [Hydrogenimonas cancrithermarum]BDY12208.1 tRNA/tmRNA (uracil-C(5))-methyltransferase [Hydrogenimonas cancrithermarum]